MFYNVHTRSVEDLTEKAYITFHAVDLNLILPQGLNDLRNGVIRTPLPPRETFLDDPLRVIRCVRFASRFNFELVPELRHAAMDPEIQVDAIHSSTHSI